MPPQGTAIPRQKCQCETLCVTGARKKNQAFHSGCIWSHLNSSGIYMSFQKEINCCPFPNHLFIAAGLCGTTLVHCILESSLFAKHFTIFPLQKLLNLVMVHSSASPGASSSKVQLCFECKFTANSTAWHSSGWRTTYVCSSGQNLYPLELRVQEPRWDAWGCGSWKRFLSSFQWTSTGTGMFWFSLWAVVVLWLLAAPTSRCLAEKQSVSWTAALWSSCPLFLRKTLLAGP